MSSEVRVPAGELRRLAVTIVLRMGFEPAEADVIADHLVDAALCGYPEALGRLVTLYGQPHRSGRTITVAHDSPAAVRLDGGGGLGYLVLDRLTSMLIDRARTHGLALGGAYNCTGGGRSAYYLERVARAGFVGLHAASGGGASSVAPPGATRPILGTNPIAFGFPGLVDPVVFDMGTSAVTMADLRLRQQLGQQLPAGVAIDETGQPTTDPGRALLGSLLTFGGYKGFGLSLSVQLLGVLAGSGEPGATSGYGSMMLVVDPDVLLPPGRFVQDAAAFLSALKALPRIPGTEEIRLPSERAFRDRAAALRDGLDLDPGLVAGLRAIAEPQAPASAATTGAKSSRSG